MICIVEFALMLEFIFSNWEYPAGKSRLTKINFNFRCDLICKLQIIDYICNINNQFTKLK